MKSLHRSREMCEWDDFAQDAQSLRARLAEGLAGQLSPFQFLTVPGVSAREQRDCSELWTKDRRARSVAIRDDLAFCFDDAAREKIRIGYLSNDFQDHATLLLLIEMSRRMTGRISSCMGFPSAPTTAKRCASVLTELSIRCMMCRR